MKPHRSHLRALWPIWLNVVHKRPILLSVWLLHDDFCDVVCKNFQVEIPTHSLFKIHVKMLNYGKYNSVHYRACTVSCMSSSCMKTSIFFCPQENKKPALSKNSTLEPDHFQKLATLVPRKAVNIWNEGKEGKKSPFTKIILSEYMWTGFSWTKQQFQVILITVSKIKAK